MRGRRRVRFGGWVFDSHPGHHSSGVHVLRELKDWLGGGQWRREEIGRPTAHGAFDLRGFLPQRVITLDGTLMASSSAELQHFVRGIQGLASDGSLFRVSVDDDGGTTWRDVRLAQSASVKERDETTADFTVTFWAADPRAYGESRRFPAGTAAYHYGSADAMPVYEVTGTGSGYTLSAGGKSFVVSSALASGGKDVIDMRTGRVHRNGALLVGGVGSAVTWTIPAGQRVTHSVVGASAAVAVVTDTYV